ncbi:amidohydrolase family protein [Mucilaginibacter ginsenosidivorax]|uniref:Amidohydrolase family protein n=1 Tax=Mucilaginibacter ginsenosidivorax TaxID=862126 RepID=A0A5B8W380_9SPHI|nr:amidohydrolase family protein [Mucilaginibacter ginsenosidivorax]QEC78173.1 amidohydrolase family protein [Mucilaginibacter ginsenosidivorax]
MKKNILLAPLLALAFNVKAQTTLPTDSGTFFLHKFAQHIGKETYWVTKYKDAIKYTVDFKFVDRGSPVPLKASLKVDRDGYPIELVIKGKTSRFSTIDDSVRVVDRNGVVFRVDDKVTAYKMHSLINFPVAGYSPTLVQQAMLQYWKKNKQPASIRTLPFGSVQIKKDGTDQLTFNGKPLLLERYTVNGLVWGNELIWTDTDGKLICLITNDAEGDKLESMRSEYESLLPELISKAAVYGMQIFAKAASPAGAVNKVIAITGGNLVDVNTGTSMPDAVILIEDGLVKATGKAGAVKIPAGAKIIDAKGKTILPGLWDMHSHFEQAEWGPAYLAAGVTTVRDCGNEFEYINAIKSAIDGGRGVGPNILKAGIIDGKGPMSLGVIQADTKDEAIKAVDRYKENGFAQIKIYSSVKPAIVKAICDEAHKLGLTVTGHIPNGMTLQQGVDSGMNMVNHEQYVYAILKRNKDRSVDFDDSVSVAAIKFIKDHHVVIDPTLGVFELAFRNVKDSIINLEPAFGTLPPPLQTLFKNMGMEPEQAAKYKPLTQSMAASVKKLYDAGVTIVAGTDMGFPGFSLDRELELYVLAGLTPAQALKTATITPAQAMGVDKQTGSVEAGKQADIIIVDGDPLTNISDVRKVTTVIKGGRVYDPVVLHRMVGFSR